MGTLKFSNLFCKWYVNVKPFPACATSPMVLSSLGCDGPSINPFPRQLLAEGLIVRHWFELWRGQGRSLTVQVQSSRELAEQLLPAFYTTADPEGNTSICRKFKRRCYRYSFPQLLEKSSKGYYRGNTEHLITPLRSNLPLHLLFTYLCETSR